MVIKGMVRNATEADAELTEEVLSECGTFGSVKSLQYFQADAERPEVDVAVQFVDADAAARCVQRMAGRVFDGRVLQSGYLAPEVWDKISAPK